MFSYLAKTFMPPQYPSVVLAVGNFGSMVHILHVIPETGAIERFGSNASTLPSNRAREQIREHIGTVTLYMGDGETANTFLDEIEDQIRKLWDEPCRVIATQHDKATGDLDRLVQDIVRPSAMNAIRKRETRERSMNTTQTYPVYIIHIRRSRPGKLIQEYTSFPP